MKNISQEYELFFFTFSTEYETFFLRIWKKILQNMNYFSISYMFYVWFSNTYYHKNMKNISQEYEKNSILLSANNIATYYI